jgi:hypothetical protein
MTRGAYNAYRGWTVPEDENPDDAGYLVEYPDGGTPNHDMHTGYISWSPKAQHDAGNLELHGVGDDTEPHVLRVVAEKTELDQRLTALQAFIAGNVYAGLAPSVQETLSIQLSVMISYSLILMRRLG